MEEFLKSIRGTHRLLLVLSAAAFVASLVPMRTVSYWRAMMDLQGLEWVNRQSLAGATSAFIEGTLKDREQGWWDAGDDAYLRVHVYAESESSPNHDDFQDFHESMVRFNLGGDIITRLLAATYPDQQLMFETATLSQIQSAFGYPVFLPFPRESDLEALRTCVENERPSAFVMIRVKITDDASHDLPIPGNPLRHGTAFVNGEKCVSFRHTASSLRELQPLSPEGSEISEAMSSEYFQPDVTDSVFGMFQRTPWEITRNLTISEARRELQRLLESQETPQSAFGGNIQVYRTLMIDVATIGLPALLILLGLHVHAALKVAPSKNGLAFPWMGIYPTPLAQGMTIGSLMFPSLALHRLHSMNASGVIGEWLLPLILVAAGTLVWLYISRLASVLTSVATGQRDLGS